MLQVPSGFEMIVQLKVQLGQARAAYWLSTLFCFQWWLSIFVPLGFIGVWLKVAKRTMIVETMVYGLLWATASVYLDFAGTSFMLWEYPYTLVPMASKNLSANLTSIPISFMLVYQYCRTLKRFFLATVAISFVFSFMCEPILVWLGMYKLYHWMYYYSFFLYVLLLAMQSRHCK